MSFEKIKKPKPTTSEEYKLYFNVITVEPVIKRGPLSMRVKEDEPAMFECDVEGTAYPVTQITWRKMGSALDVSTTLIINLRLESFCIIIFMLHSMS